ncbi:hypothetical protein Y032_0073g727 [Ancylostoma ceylanicum]|uniref:Uncharacterized protein n=1 Tax=Ancylostoma ceylanicum TaxID=53326 RepID=A0A016TWS5_9BILA|nr:hypothetical protein Y032_0073g727 [Ancylostoma ceylanicum]
MVVRRERAPEIGRTDEHAHIGLGPGTLERDGGTDDVKGNAHKDKGRGTHYQHKNATTLALRRKQQAVVLRARGQSDEAGRLTINADY